MEEATRGESGYYNSEVTVTLPSAYFGAGIAGFVPSGSDEDIYDFGARVRESDFQRPRSDLSQPPFKAGVGDTVSRRVSLTLYYKGDNYLPDFEQYEFLLFEIFMGGELSKQFVLLIESFKQTGDVERAVEYAVSGETDGIFWPLGY
jgi:hypothetical protein